MLASGLRSATANCIVIEGHLSDGIGSCSSSTDPLAASMLATLPRPRWRACSAWVAATVSPAPGRRPSVLRRLASESIRNWPETTTLSPGLSPLRISASAPDSTPTSTSMARNVPSPSARITTLLSPVRMTASAGTSRTSRPCTARTRFAYIPGLSLPAGFAISMRARTERTAAFTSGRIALTRPANASPGYAGTRASTRLPGARKPACASGTCATTHTVAIPAMRKSVEPEATVMPSRAPSSTMTPETGARNTTRGRAFPSLSRVAICSSLIPRSVSRWCAADARSRDAGSERLRSSRNSSCAAAQSGNSISTSGSPARTASSGART